MDKITLGSLFDGVAGFPCVASWYGIEPVWASEIEAAPIRIASRHFPNMKQLGDITKIHGDKIQKVDIITFGSPCQSLSAAGKQDGISYVCDNCGHIIEMVNYKDEVTCPECGEELRLSRSGLFLDAIRVIKEMRSATNECFPKIVVWENVFAATTSNNGDDFYIVLKEFCELIHERLPVLRPARWSNSGEIVGDNGSIAWRILDAQYWGVPQRRRRIFLVCDLRGQSAGEVLFKQQSLRRHSPTCETPWEKFTAKARKSVDSADATETKISL